VLRDLATAIRLLTVLPVGSVDGVHPGRYFALVGWVYGAVGVGIASGAAWLGRDTGVSALLAGVIVVAVWTALTGFMHLDGIADCADGFGVRGDAARRLEVMHDSTVGAFGVTAIVLVVLAEVASIAVIVESGAWWALGAAPVLGRWGAGMALGLREPARDTGLAARYSHRETGLGIAVQTLPVLPLLFAAPEARHPFVAATVAGMLVAFFLPGPFIRRFGGISGDVLGAVIVLTELFVLVLGAVAGGAL
jgi:adenosylcobinamide-GDP ribazoletransferase